ncbi:NAD(P)/FAD-dependent oxidoreductase [Azospirillum soli]|uniref:NAD(P)/FAD-dependent oxidoreductase n=1 Tax=Azospirillum soli TaxID=1304799 RepID=UPI001AE4AC4C|nr:FAD-binding oxidoreductase [Azospirillum soli]MBP2314682.1 sarcosine oxidase [Azospirillum soli]
MTGMPASHWAATAVAAPETAPLKGPLQADVAVVGAGITGLSAAIHLAESGVRVVLLEAAEAGFGGSGRNNGQIIPTLSRLDPADLVAAYGSEKGEGLIAMIRDSAALVFSLVEKHGLRCDAVQKGWIQPAHRPGRMVAVGKRVAQWQARGADVRLLDAEAARAALGTDFWHGAMLAPTGGHVNPLSLVREMARAAIGLGVGLHTDTPVTGLERAGSAWRLTTPQGSVTAERVILATNAYTDDLWPGLRRSIVPVLNFQMVTKPLPPELRASILPADMACSDTQGDLHFFRWTADDRLVSGCTLISLQDADRRAQERVRDRIARVFPQAGRPAIERSWSGHLAMTADFRPHFHELAPGVVAAVGYNGRGMALGAAVGRELAKFGAGTDSKDLPLPFTPLRTLPLHALVTRFAPAYMAHLRRLDATG